MDWLNEIHVLLLIVAMVWSGLVGPKTTVVTPQPITEYVQADVTASHITTSMVVNGVNYPCTTFTQPVTCSTGYIPRASTFTIVTNSTAPYSLSFKEYAWFQLIPLPSLMRKYGPPPTPPPGYPVPQSLP